MSFHLTCLVSVGQLILQQLSKTDSAEMHINVRIVCMTME